MKKKNLIQLLSLSFICLMAGCFMPLLSQAQKDSTKSQKVQQVEIVTFKPGTSEANQHFVDDSFRNALNQLPVVHTFLSVVGNDSENSGQVKHVYITTFDSKGDLTTYNASPQHQAVKKASAPYVSNIVAVDYPVNK